MTGIDFTAPVDTFRALVERVRKVVEKRNTIPILANIRVAVAKGGSLTLTGTDLDIWASAAAPGATAHTPGEITVPAALLFDILRKASGEIRFCDDGSGRVTLKVGRSRYMLNALPASDFPEIPAAADGARFEIAPQALTRIAACCSFAISTEETRYYLNGVYLHQVDAAQGIVAVATDGHKLSRVEIDRPGAPAFAGVIVPRKTVQLFDLITSACKAGEAIRITIDGARMALETDDLTLISKLIDGKFPDYQRVIPKDLPHTAEVPRDELADAIERVSTVAAERGRGVRCVFSAEALKLSVEDQANGSAEDEIAADFNADEALTIGFNGRYVREALATFPGERLQLALGDAGSPAILTDPGDASRLVVLMPMRV